MQIAPEKIARQMAPIDKAQKVLLKKMMKYLDEGTPALKMHQKHINVSSGVSNGTS